MANLYKGGSLALHDSLISEVGKSRSHVIITFDCAKNRQFKRTALARVILLPYPLRFLNLFYRFILEHAWVPLIGVMFQAKELVMFGNFPAAFWFGHQRVFFHNSNYLAKAVAGGSPWFALERRLFSFLARNKNNTSFFCQLDRTREALAIAGIEATAMRVPVSEPILPCRDIGGGRLALFYPAFLYPSKNHQFLLDAHSILSKNNCKVLLTVEQRQFTAVFGQYAEIFENIGIVPRSEVLKVYERTDALIFPSLSESLGYPLIEGLMAGVPVLAADLPYAHQALGATGIFFDPTDVDSLGRALSRVRAERLCEARRQGQLQRITCSATEFIDELLNEK